MTKQKQEKLTFWLFLIPALLSFTLVVIVPFIMGLYYSFTDWAAVGKAKVNWIGLDNYKSLFNDVKFIYSFGRTFLYTIVNVLAVNIVAFTLAVLVTRRLKLTNLYRIGFFIPNLIGGLILGYIWQFIFNNVVPGFGELIGSPTLSDLLILADSKQTFIGLIIVGTWQYAGYIMMIYVAALQNVPTSLIEASKIDGANGFQRMVNITLPLVAQAFTVTSFLTLVNSFKQFDVIWALTQGGPPTQYNGTIVNSTEILAVNIYNTAFKYNEMAEAQAKAVIFFIILMIISLVQVYNNKKREVEM